jgi:hypothetical protein
MRLHPLSLPSVAAMLAPLLGGGLAAQSSDALYTRVTGLTGFEYRGYSFDPGISLKSVSQWNIPFIAVAPLGRHMSVDLTTHVVSGRIATFAGTEEKLSGLSDTQLRLLYTLGRDRLVTSLTLSLPTGQRSVSTSQFEVASAVGSNYLSFPVASFGTAFGVTAGAAYARTLGSWNIGLSGALRYTGNYSPFSDQALSYNPGWEGRLRAGADRVIGSGRLLVGLTFSDFSTDVYTGTGALVSGWYHPGSRFIGDLAYLRVVGSGTLTVAMWDYYRLAGHSNAGANQDTKENVFNWELRYGRRVAPRLQLEPLVAFRQWSPADYRGGRLYSAGLGARYAVSDQLSGHFTGRLDTGWIYAAGRGLADLTGTGLTVWLRYQR